VAFRYRHGDPVHLSWSITVNKTAVVSTQCSHFNGKGKQRHIFRHHRPCHKHRVKELPKALAGIVVVTVHTTEERASDRNF
jgi:hypothetical protein